MGEPTTIIRETSMPASLRTFIDASADAVAKEIATIRRDATRERELRDAQFAARMAELETRIASVSEIERRLGERLATLKDGEPGLAGRDGTNGVDGTSVSIEAVQEMVNAECERILAGWERPQDGRSVTVDDVAPMIAESIASMVSALPSAKDGRDGVDGKDGRDGIDGKDGERGIEGPIGKLPVVAEWADRVYYEGEVVTRDGSTFQANCDTGKAPGHDDWRCIVSAGANGRDGVDGRSPEVRHTWAADGEYRALDIVALNGASFIARTDNPGACPGEGWQLMSTQGKPGKQGERGPKGDTGHVRAVSAMRADDDGLLTLVNADGTTVECDLYPLLSQIGGR